MSTELKGEDLRVRVRQVIAFDGVFDEGEWYLVPAMLEWLGRRAIAIWRWSDGGYSIKITDGSSSTGHDLPTALARLVLRVAELEGKS